MSGFRQICSRMAVALIARVQRRDADFYIGGRNNPYLLRWWLLPRNNWFNVYLHEFRRDDDDRALHDHPWPSLSILLRGRYVEHTIDRGGVHRRRISSAGSVCFRGPRFAHRIELVDGAPCWTVFVTGPRLRSWGFHCPNGWVHWREFTDPETGGATVGRGCGEDTK